WIPQAGMHGDHRAHGFQSGGDAASEQPGGHVAAEMALRKEADAETRGLSGLDEFRAIVKLSITLAGRQRMQGFRNRLGDLSRSQRHIWDRRVQPELHESDLRT